ncbi:TetR/AcrR family transcriptional regulator [Actinopolymorpha alba]|uniref:TetR/AcrR family transcriptional regulator n=1 Tax=Actinopolymorpha alba TaxID=533267 RepID=UPI0003661996|nr:TetR/AcrR family transcriptional regulator [Actinopolymorpha alba]
MSSAAPPPASTSTPARRADAGRNDQRVLAAAREVLEELGADAPMSAIAARAGVGMGSLYRRFRSKEDLIRQLGITAMDGVGEEVRAALEEEPDGWAAFTRFMLVCTKPASCTSVQFAGTYTVTEEIRAAWERRKDAIQELVDRAHAEGSLRPDVTGADVSLLLAQWRARHRVHDERAAALHQKYVKLALRGLRAPADEESTSEELGATWDELRERWLAALHPRKQ